MTCCYTIDFIYIKLWKQAKQKHTPGTWRKVYHFLWAVNFLFLVEGWKHKGMFHHRAFIAQILLYNWYSSAYFSHFSWSETGMTILEVKGYRRHLWFTFWPCITILFEEQQIETLRQWGSSHPNYSGHWGWRMACAQETRSPKQIGEKAEKQHPL